MAGMQMRGVVLALASALLFGASTPASKLLLERLGPFQLAGLLYLGAALATGLAREPARGDGARLDGRNRARLLGAIAAGGIAGPVLLLLGLRLTLAGSVSLLLNLEMAATAALGVLWFREPLRPGGWAGVAGVVGAGVLVSWEGGTPGWMASLLVAAACLCWGLDNQLTARIDGLSPRRSTFWKGLVAGSTNLALGLPLEPARATPLDAAAALAVGALAYGASIALYIRSAQQLGATRAQALFASAPFLGAALSFSVLGEPLGAGHLAGGALIAVSAFVLLRSSHEHAHVHEPLDHVHEHRHDDGHHAHEHPDLPPATRHTHWHHHDRLAHSHPHWPDLHHRHPH
jgi:drug/metabolite transporter (DMT)-like permease